MAECLDSLLHDGGGAQQLAVTGSPPQQTPQFYLVNGILWRVNYVNPTAYITVNGMLIPVSR